MNHLHSEASPYLLQHADNPVDWYPWCAEAFDRAKREQKPIFLSIGYSTCHWCHVMAKECFGDQQVAAVLNQHFISIKVDKEERPDVDGVYMAVCQAMTGSGGWPTSIFMTPDQAPFFAGTYFPKLSGPYGVGFLDLLAAVVQQWRENRAELERVGQSLIRRLAEEERRSHTPACDSQSFQRQAQTSAAAGGPVKRRAIRVRSTKVRPLPRHEQSGLSRGLQDAARLDDQLTAAVDLAKAGFDKEFAGFGRAPKFPAPHGLCFLLEYYEKTGDQETLMMAEKTLQQLYRGGIFDHIGFGFSRYSTDRQFLVPHFEKMLYDNALLILAYAKAYAVTRKSFYRQVAEQTAQYVLREMTSPSGGFYSAQDADAQGQEGSYYLLTPQQVQGALGPELAAAYCKAYDITQGGNFEGRSIANLLCNPSWARPWMHAARARGASEQGFAQARQTLYDYRKQRMELHLDDKILTAWNAWMILAFTALYQLTQEPRYLQAAQNARRQVEQELYQQGRLYVGVRDRRRSGEGFLDDYSAYALALLGLYQATLNSRDLELAMELTQTAVALFYDQQSGGFYTTGRDHEALIFRKKEVYDGAIPSGNSTMAYVLVRLWQITKLPQYETLARRQLEFMAGAARDNPFGHSFYLTALLQFQLPAASVTVVLSQPEDRKKALAQLPAGAAVTVLEAPTRDYPLLHGRLTFYVCKDRSCMPPVNQLDLDR